MIEEPVTYTNQPSTTSNGGGPIAETEPPAEPETGDGEGGNGADTEGGETTD